MSEAKHTPGPWECNGDLVHKDGFQIAIVEAHYEDYVELQQANARLIAAAPDLLTALEYAIWAHPELEKSKTVMDAIAKATGASA